MKTNTVETLFGPWPIERRRVRFRVIRPVFETLTINDLAEEYTGKRFTSPRDIFEKFSYLANESKEYFLALHLDGKNRIVCLDTISVGSLNQSIVHPREVFKSSLLSSAAALVLLHNHPTGDPTPSSEDLSITRRLKEAGELMGVKVIDHIIIGNEAYMSFVEQGML